MPPKRSQRINKDTQNKTCAMRENLYIISYASINETMLRISLCVCVFFFLYSVSNWFWCSEIVSEAKQNKCMVCMHVRCCYKFVVFFLFVFSIMHFFVPAVFIKKRTVAFRSIGIHGAKTIQFQWIWVNGSEILSIHTYFHEYVYDT